MSRSPAVCAGWVRVRSFDVMGALTLEVRHFAEEPNAEVSEPLPPEARVRTPSFILDMGGSPTLSSVSRVRTSVADLDETIGEVRAELRKRGYTCVTWLVGPSSEPHGLKELLLSRGFVPATRPPYEPTAEAMALVQAPPPAPPDVEARLCRDYEEYLEALRVAMKTFDIPEDGVAGWMAAAPALWKQQDGVHRMTLVARVDGRVVGFGFAAGGPRGLLLCGSGVLADARGRGAYRALVAARWRIAVDLGTPALVIHAESMSQPIVERCGFERVCRVDVLIDPEIH